MITTTPALNRRTIAESILGTAIDWIDADTGLLPHCPGEHLHTHRSGKRDCQIIVEGAPTLFCFHTSCAGILEERNMRLRSINFRSVSELLKESKCPGNFTCPATFKNSVYSRSNENVLTRPYLVIESDTLSRGQMLSVIAWCQQFMRLRAIVDTGGKSLHGWFDYPPEASLVELKTILPAIGCDPALFKPAQPCRLPGAWRSEKSNFQHLRYLDLK